MRNRKPKLDRESLLIAKHERALAAKEEKLGGDAPALVAPICALYQLYVAQGKHQQAEGMVRKAMAIQEQALGQNHAEIAKSLHALAGQLSKQRKFAEAEVELRRALKVLENVHGTENHIAMEFFLDDLCGAIVEQNRKREILPLGLRMLAIQEQAYGPDDVRVAVTLRKLGKIQYELDDTPESGRLLLRALLIRDKLADESARFELADLLHDVGNHFASTLRFQAAEGYYHRAIQIWRGPAGGEIQEPRAALLFNHMAKMYARWGQAEKAEQHYRQAIALCPPQDPLLAFDLDALGTMRLHADDFEESESLLLRAVAIREQVLGREHPHTAISLNNLASVYLKQDLFDRAEPLLLRSIAIADKSPATKPADLAAACCNLGALYYGQKNYEQAEKLTRKSLAINEKAYGPDSPELDQSLWNLAAALRAMDRIVEAQEFEEWSRRIKSKQ
jgi:tetratricopeptide (TPR) repeat protein